MTTHRPVLAPLAVLAAALLCASCTSTEEEPATETATETMTETVTESATRQVSASAKESPEASKEPATSEPAPALSAGSFHERVVTICTAGDGWGVGLLGVNGNTSCDFAHSVLNSLTAGIGTTTVNLRDYLPQTVTAYSPVTGQSYDMYCTSDAAEVISCRGGNNAEVLMY